MQFASEGAIVSWNPQIIKISIFADGVKGATTLTGTQTLKLFLLRSGFLRFFKGLRFNVQQNQQEELSCLEEQIFIFGEGVVLINQIHMERELLHILIVERIHRYARVHTTNSRKAC